jgi:hypothetical protein
VWETICILQSRIRITAQPGLAVEKKQQNTTWCCALLCLIWCTTDCQLLDKDSENNVKTAIQFTAHQILTKCLTDLILANVNKWLQQQASSPFFLSLYLHSFFILVTQLIKQFTGTLSNLHFPQDSTPPTELGGKNPCKSL